MSLRPVAERPFRTIGPALALGVLVVYAQVRGFDFLRLDDPLYVTENPHVRGGLTLSGAAWAFASGHAGNWHPVTWLSHMIDCQLFGLNAGAHHLVNVLLHLASTLLLFGVLSEMTGRVRRSGVVAALFALHPLHVESVAWIAERKDVLSGFFFMVTLSCWLRFARTSATRWYAAALVTYALGLMSKPMLVTIPFVLLLLDFWPLERLLPAGAAWRSIAPRLLEKVPFVALAAASSIVTVLVQRSWGAVVSVEALSPWTRAANAVVSYVRYAGAMIWPAGLSVFYPYPKEISSWAVAGAATFLLAVGVLAARRARTEPYFVTGWLWYLVTLLPVIGLVQVGSQARADRYTYLPLVGLFIVVVWGASDLAGRRPATRAVAASAAAVAIVACAALAFVQAGHWRNTLQLARHSLEVNAADPVAHFSLANALSRPGGSEEAIAHYREALRINPEFAEAHNNLGNELAAASKGAEAVEHFREALRINPNYADAHVNLGVELVAQGRIDEAVVRYREAVRLRPDAAEAYAELGIAMDLQGKSDEAISLYERAVELRPELATARNDLAHALVRKGRLPEAIAHYREAIKSKPDYPEAHANLGIALALHSDPQGADAELREAIRLRPEYDRAHYHLARILAGQGDLDGAIEQYREALRFRPEWPEATNELARILATRGPVPPRPNR
jgi:tetratricopeptide (TPR) repeat protein